jgi:hypothetical protein
VIDADQGRLRGAYVRNDPVNNIDPDGTAPLFIALPAIGGGINGVLQGYETVLKGGSALDIAAAAGKGFISGYAGIAAGLATALVNRSPAAAGAVGKVVENTVSSLLNGNIPTAKDLTVSATVGAVIGKGAQVALPVPTKAPDFIYQKVTNYNPTDAKDAARMIVRQWVAVRLAVVFRQSVISRPV